MSRPIRVFVSSSPDLVSEREALGQAMAELPIAVGCEISHTPPLNENVGETLALVERCDLFVLVLGADFAAPMGLEWRQALNTGKPVLAYRKRVFHSPSARTFRRESDVLWTEFDSPQELKVQVALELARAILDRGERFGLHMSDVEPLLALVAVEGEAERRSAAPDSRRGAGRSGVIVDRYAGVGNEKRAD